MSSFGKKKVRSIDTFGVAGLLGEDAEVFHHALFSTRHIGGIGDLLCARLKASGVDEIKLRIILLLNAIQAYRAQFKKAEGVRLYGGEEGLGEPAILECGIDSEKLALGVCFTLRPEVKLKVEGIASRIASKEVLDPFEGLLSFLYHQADHSLVKYQPQTRRMEVVALLGVDPEAIASAKQNKGPLDFVLIKEKGVPPSPKPKSYVALGDLDYPSLLSKTKQEKEYFASATGKFLMPSDDINSTQEIAIGSINPVTGAVKPESAQESSDDIIRISGKSEDLADTDVAVVSGSGGKKGSKFGLGSLFGGVKKLFSKTTQGAKSESPDDSEDIDSVVVSSSASPIQESDDLAKIDAFVAEGDANKPENYSQKLLSELKSGAMGSTLAKAAEEFEAQMLKEMKSQKAVNWVSKLLSRLAEEKLELNKLARTIDQSIRAKEIVFQDKLEALQNEIKVKDAQITAKNTVIHRTKEQLTLATGTVDKLRALNQETTQTNAEEANFKQRYAMAQKLLSVARAENANLVKRVEDLRTKLSEQPTVQAVQKTASNETTVLQVKYERLTRQLEEFKKSNRQLQERLTTVAGKTSPGSAQENAELKKRLEAAMKLSSDRLQEAETLRARVTAYHKQEIRMKLEINRLQVQINGGQAKAKPPERPPGSGGTGGPGGTTGTPPAAA